jgi:hypothetical protein
MAVRAVDPEVQRERGRALWDLHYEWSGEQIAAGVDGPVPSGRKPGSDYNQHVPDLEASGQAMDEFHNAARKIMGLEPLTA